MIGTLILAFLACMAIASLGLLALIRLGVIDRQWSLILFIAMVPLAGWVALAAEAAAPGPALMLPDDEPPVRPVEIERLWPRGFVDSADRLRPPVEEEQPAAGTSTEIVSGRPPLIGNINADNPSYHLFACCILRLQTGRDRRRIRP